MNPTCEKTQERIIEAMGGSFHPEKDPDLRVHLQICPACRELWEDCEKIRVGMDAWEAEGPSDLTTARILKAAQERQVHVKTGTGRSGWAFLLSRPFQVAAMLALIVGVGIYSQKWMQKRGHEMQPSFDKAPMPAPAEPAVPPVIPAPQLAPEASEGAAAPALPQPVGGAKRAPSPPGQNGKSAPADATLKEKAAKPVPLPAQPAPKGEAKTEMFDATGRAAPAGAAGMERREPIKDQPPPPAEEAPAPRAKQGIDAAPAPKAMQAPAATTITPAAPPPAPALEAEKARDQEVKKESEDAKSTRRKLVASAKSKINIGDYNGALQDLVKAEQQGSTPEIHRLIQLCRDKLKPVPTTGN